MINIVKSFLPRFPHSLRMTEVKLQATEPAIRKYSAKKLTTQKMMFSIKDFFSKCDQICNKLWIWSYLLKKSLMENFIFCKVTVFKNFKKIVNSK